MSETTELNPRTFDVLAMAKGESRSYPQDILDVYLDEGAAHKAYQIEQKIAYEKDPEKVTALDAERNALLEGVKGSRLTFHMKGLSQKVIKAVEDKADAKFGQADDIDGKPHQEKILWRNMAWLAAHIADVYNATDERDPRVWTSEAVYELAEVLPATEFNKLMLKMQELTFKAAYFEQMEVTPDFS